MILQESQISDIVLNNPNKSYVLAGRKYNAAMRMHMYGENLQNFIEKIPVYEDEALTKLRAAYAKSNKDIFSRLSRPIDKVFGAKGGSRYYNLSESQDQKAATLATNVRDGFSAKKWVENFWKPHLLDDPFGIIFMEIGDGTTYALGQAYPTYRSITYIYDCLRKGNRFEYLVFELDKSDRNAMIEKARAMGATLTIEEKAVYYRVIDDANDYIVKRMDQKVDILKSETIPNYFGKVPAMLNSDFVSGKDGNPISLFDDALELGEHLFRKGSIREVHELKHGFPKYWEYSDNCSECSGTGYKGSEECPTCKGTGKSLMTKVSDAKLLNYPEDKDSPIVAPNVAGYVEPSDKYNTIVTQRLAEYEQMMSYTIWGASNNQETNGPTGQQPNDAPKTATEVITDIQPKIDRLYPLSEMAESRDKFIMDMIIMQNMRVNSYLGSSINYGRRYLIESGDALWEKYSNARKNGASISVLDDLLSEYIEAKYSGDAITLNMQQKLMIVEPFVHNTVSEVKALGVPYDDFLKKLYFLEWKGTLTKADLVLKPVENLKTMLDAYITAKNIKEPKPANPILN